MGATRPITVRYTALGGSELVDLVAITRIVLQRLLTSGIAGVGGGHFRLRARAAGYTNGWRGVES